MRDWLGQTQNFIGNSHDIYYNTVQWMTAGQETMVIAPAGFLAPEGQKPEEAP